MKKILVAVGSMRRPKLNAVWEALSVIGPTLHEAALYDVVGVEVESGVSHMPISREELMSGARGRAEELVRLGKERGEAWEYFVGLEGGFDVVHENARRLVFLQSWAYVTDGVRGAYGQSGAILVPERLARRVVDEGVELSVAIDAFSGEQGVRDAQGAWGIFTRNLHTRQDSFRTAVINAFAPFFNSALYDKA
jgi:inosine/xanthosine triphosphatase